jgi:type IV pilus assembly protein PilA
MHVRQRKKNRPERGFTLIELMVVVLVIAILMAIAIPTFLSARASASARAAESNIRNAVTDEQSYFSQSAGDLYGPASLLVDYSVDAALSFTSSWPAPAPSVLVDVVTDAAGNSAVLLGTRGRDGNAYWAYDDNGQLTYLIDSGAQPTTFPLPDPSWP